MIPEVGTVKLPLDASSEVTFQAPGSPAERTFVPGPNEAKVPEFVISLLGLREYRARRIE